jgi:hypothetical protein
MTTPKTAHVTIRLESEDGGEELVECEIPHEQYVEIKRQAELHGITIEEHAHAILVAGVRAMNARARRKGRIGAA